MSHLTRIAAGLLAVGLLSIGCETASAEKAAADKHDDHKHTALAKDTPAAGRADEKEAAHPTAVANIMGAGAHKDKIKGTVTFVQRDRGVEVLVDVTGLTPGKHGIHIHEKADLSDPELKGAGPHWNPDGHKHAGPTDENRHAGDLGNITADDKGHAKTRMTISGVTVGDTEKTSVVGRSVIIHEKEDDLKTDPSGNSGGRIAGGVIEQKPSGKTGEKETK
jgi:Cu-Zn family superoxide dismutase